jgi:hypothetical protein
VFGVASISNAWGNGLSGNTASQFPGHMWDLEPIAGTPYQYGSPGSSDGVVDNCLRFGTHTHIPSPTQCMRSYLMIKVMREQSVTTYWPPGFRWYDTRVMTILANIRFSNYQIYQPELGNLRQSLWFSMTYR